MVQNPPPWLHQALRDARLRYPGYAFDVVARLVPNPSTGGQVTLFRLVCGDCPGMLYHLGPGDTLSNFEMHLKDAHHRHRAQERMHPRRSLL
ncbi:hypothetical protein PYCCODRAFT_645062 [Trametes coccinea BRFM310]|uniref:Uncharacterized protein n=1 Tax=Trametes coccinea (strain BRFM310) TaxID=1353009 RepID=A0A1Y2IID8_TRAC3|nr:hypothetical protein PYCCODRAFT_645062 [Trametes coccinea BRFM310]